MANALPVVVAKVDDPCMPIWRLRTNRALASLALTLPMLVHAACQLRSGELPVKMVGSRAVATVDINGTPVPLMVDSGAFYSFLTDAAADQLKLTRRRGSELRVEGITGRVETSTTIVDRLQLLKGEVPRVEFVVGGNEPGSGTMGIMGRNLLAFTDTEYDLAHGMIRFHVPNGDCGEAGMAYWAGSSPFTEIDLVHDYRYKVPQLLARVRLNGHELVALLDTGATTVVTLGAAKRAGVAEADMKPAGTLYGAGRGSARAWTADFERFELGGETVLHNRLQVADFDMEDADMLLGIDFFLSHRIYVSKQQSKLFITYNGGTVFALNKGEAASPEAFDAGPAASGVPVATADELARRGAASFSRGAYATALAELNRSVALDPASASAYAQRGAIQEAMKHPAQAMEDEDTALQLDPALAEARGRRAALRFRAKDRDGAAADLDVLDRTLAPQAQARLSMAALYLALEQPARALAQLNQWLAAHPNEVRRDVALNSRCWSRAMLGIELDDALDDCNDALDSNAKNPNYLDSRGWVYLRLGKYAKALSDFDRSIGERPESAWTLYGRGLAKTRLGDASQGEADLAAARKLQPDIDAKVANLGLTTEPSPKP